MTIFLILGAVAGLYVLALLFRLASYALPVYAGLTCAFLLLRHDVGHLGAILGGLSAGIATLLTGQGLIAFVRSPLLRVGIAFLFAIPGGIGIELILPDWFYAGVLDRGLILTIDRAYFALTGGVERWLYRIVRKHGGHQRGGWSFDVPHLHLKSGALSPLKQFAFELRSIVRQQSLPGYHLSLEHSFGRERLIFKPIPVDPFVAAARRVGFPVEKLA